jgi:hypothetical protein
MYRVSIALSLRCTLLILYNAPLKYLVGMELLLHVPFIINLI